MDAESVGGGNAKGEDTTMDDVDANVVIYNADDVEDNGTGVEWRYCFADYPFVRAAFFIVLSYPHLSLLPLSPKWMQFPEAHLFCSTCISTYAAAQLGTHNSSNMYPFFLMFFPLPSWIQQGNRLFSLSTY